jgi:integrase
MAKITSKAIAGIIAAIPAAQALKARLEQAGELDPANEAHAELIKRAGQTRITCEDGLFLKVYNRGPNHFWYMEYTFGVNAAGKPAARELSIGRYCEGDDTHEGRAIGLKIARQRVDAAHKLLHETPPRDPSAERQEVKLKSKRAAMREKSRKAGEAIENSLRDWSQRYMDKHYRPDLGAHSPWSKATYVAYKGDCEKKLWPALGDLDITDITDDVVVPVLEKIKVEAAKRSRKGGGGAQHRARLTLSGILAFAKTHKAIKHNPITEVNERVPAHRSVSYKGPETADEVRDLLVRIEGYPGPLQTKLALKLHIMLMQRPGFVSSMRWADVNLTTGEWKVPASRMPKRKLDGRVGQGARDHLVILPAQALAILRAYHQVTGAGEYVFEGKPGVPMSHDTLNNALVVMGYKRGTIHSHAFSRVTGMTCGTQYCGISKDVINAIMDHTPDDPLKSVYMRATWKADRLRDMQKYADWLDDVFAGKPDAMFMLGEREIIEARATRLADMPVLDLDALREPRALPMAEVVPITGRKRA